MMKKTIKLWTAAVLAVAVLLIVTTLAAPEKAYELSLDTGLDVLSVYICYEPKDGMTEPTVRFSNELSGYGYSNFKDGKLWISIAAAEPIDCTKPLAYITATDSDGSSVVPEMDMTLLKINGRKISDIGVCITEAAAKRNGEDISVSVKIKDELQRKGITLFVAAYNNDGKMTGVVKEQIIPKGSVTVLDVKVVGASDAKCLKVMLLSDTLKPYAESAVIEEITEG